MNARLYLDEDISPELARLLRAIGWDVVSAHERDALQLSDEEQLARAAAAGRAIVTCNCADFLVLARRWAGAGRAHGGIVLSYRQYPKREMPAMARLVARFLTQVSADDLRGAVYVLDAFRVG